MEAGRLEILKMLEEKKITVEEAMQLLQALKAPEQNAERAQAASTPGSQAQPNWDRHSNDHETRSSTQNAQNGNPFSLRGLFSAFKMAGANFNGARLEGAKTEGANLMGANLEDADLREADLRNANLIGANLSEANLRGANLRGANLTGANLEGGNFVGANLEGANLIGANLAEANGQNADLRGQNLMGANFEGMSIRDLGVFATSPQEDE